MPQANRRPKLAVVPQANLRLKVAGVPQAICDVARQRTILRPPAGGLFRPRFSGDLKSAFKGVKSAFETSRKPTAKRRRPPGVRNGPSHVLPAQAAITEAPACAGQMPNPANLNRFRTPRRDDLFQLARMRDACDRTSPRFRGMTCCASTGHACALSPRFRGDDGHGDDDDHGR